MVTREATNRMKKAEEKEKNCKCGDECKCTPEDNCGCMEEGGECTCDDNNKQCNCKDGKEDKSAEYLELAQRIKAEFENYKRRNAEVASTSYNNGVASAVTTLLPVIDSFNQAKANITDSAVLSGVDLIYNQLMTALNSLNVEKIDCLGKVFDPNYHNAVLVGKDEAYPNDTILEEYQAGFVMNGKVIRPSVVKVNKLD